METSEICIIGGGAVGGVLAYYIYRSGLRYIPVYYSSHDSVREVEEIGGLLVVDKTRNEEILVPVSPRHVGNPVDKCKFIFNAVKAYHVESTLPLVKNLALENSVVVMLQNGFGSLELAEEALPHLKVAGGVVYYGAERTSRSKIIYHGGNTIIAGCRKKICLELHELASLFRLGGLDFRITSDIDYYRWLKLALNAVVNAITAITGGRNKVVLEEEGLSLAKMILVEVIEAAKLHGYVFNEERLLDYIVKNVRIVAENTSSMLQDIIGGRATEVDYINGYIASILGDKAPVNKALTLLVKLIEKKNRNPQRGPSSTQLYSPD